MAELTVADVTALPGQRVTGVVEIPVRHDTAEVPLILIQGSAGGPRVSITAGIHGAEYVGIEAARRLGMTLQPEQLRGSLVVVPIANTTAYFQRAIYTSGLDTNNLNRHFPGDPAGSPSQILASWLFRTIIEPSDFYIDMHGGDMIEALVPFVLAPQGGEPSVVDASYGMAKASGIERIIRSEVAGSTTGAATAAGIPSILAEIGGQGVWDEAKVLDHLESTLRVLRHLGVLAGTAGSAAQQRTYDTFAWVRAGARGLFHPTVQVGEGVSRGQRLGTIVDYFGSELQAVDAPAHGEVVFLVTALAINEGDPLLALGA